MPVKVSIVDDNEGIRSGLAAVIRRAPGLELLAEYSNAESAINKIPGEPPDVVLMDINLPGMSGVECVRELKAMRPGLQVLMLTVYEDSDCLFNSFRAGASGYLLKRNSPTRLLEAIQDVYTGGSLMTPQLARRVAQFFTAPAPAAPAAPQVQITANERELLNQLAHGYVYQEIADRMKISIETVRSCVRAVYAKLHAPARPEPGAECLRAAGPASQIARPASVRLDWGT